jgi:endonuclease/exonuclease/phosphatase (EEP) superfamily protein YafD
MVGKFVKYLVWLAVVLSLLSAASVFSAQHYLFDLIANFRIQYIVLIVPVVLVALAMRAYFSALILVLCLVFHVWTVATSIKATRDYSIEAGNSIRIMTSNLLKSNRDFLGHLDYIQTVNPDVIVFQEYTYYGDEAFYDSLDAYPHRLLIPKPHAFGIALYSKYEIAQSDVIALFNLELPALKVDITVGDASLRILGAHPTAPISLNRYNMRSRQLTALATDVADYSGPLVFVGDLNITPWSAHFRSFMKQSGLYDGRRGFGVLPTWPSNIFALSIPIDHIMVNERAEVLNIETSDGLTQSDHKAVWADIRFR